MRRLIPFLVLGAMSALALLSLVLSLSSAQRISSFATPAPGRAGDVTALAAVLQRSLGASSFTLDDALNYQSPDRSATIARGGPEPAPERVIGSRIYLYLGTTAAGAPQWGGAALSHAADQYYGPLRATQEFTMLRGADAVVRHGAVFTVRQVVPADLISPGNPGQLLLTYTLNALGGRVASVTALVQGWVTIPTQDRAGRVTWTRVDGYQAPISTYTNYDQVAAISAPPLSQTTPLNTCANGSYLVARAGVGSCTFFG